MDFSPQSSELNNKTREGLLSLASAPILLLRGMDLSSNFCSAIKEL